MNVADVLFGEPIERTLPDGWTVRIQKKTSCDKANHLWHDNAYPWCLSVFPGVWTDGSTDLEQLVPSPKYAFDGQCGCFFPVSGPEDLLNKNVYFQYNSEAKPFPQPDKLPPIPTSIPFSSDRNITCITFRKFPRFQYRWGLFTFCKTINGTQKFTVTTRSSFHGSSHLPSDSIPLASSPSAHFTVN